MYRGGSGSGGNSRRRPRDFGTSNGSGSGGGDGGSDDKQQDEDDRKPSASSIPEGAEVIDLLDDDSDTTDDADEGRKPSSVHVSSQWSRTRNGASPPPRTRRRRHASHNHIHHPTSSSSLAASSSGASAAAAAAMSNTNHDEGNWKVEMLNSINFVWDWREEYPDLVDHNHPSKPLKKSKVLFKSEIIHDAPGPIIVGDGLIEAKEMTEAKTSLPTSTVTNPNDLPNDCRECIVCMENFKRGDVRRTLPCLHSEFHAECVDRWLQSNATCPVCKHQITD